MPRQLALSAINYICKKFHLLNTPLTLATNNIYITAYKTYLHYFKKVCPLDQHDHIMSGFKCLYTSSGSSNQILYWKILTMILVMKQMLILLVFQKQEEQSRVRPLEWSANSNLKKRVERVSKHLQSRKLPSIGLNKIIIKYAIFNIQISNIIFLFIFFFKKIKCQPLFHSFFFSFGQNLELIRWLQGVNKTFFFRVRPNAILNRTFPVLIQTFHI